MKEINEILLPIIGLFLFIWYSLVQGYKQAYYYHNRHLTTENLHGYYFAEALIYGLLISIILGYKEYLLIFVDLISYGLIFPYFHDGMYYVTRNNLDNNIYKMRWYSETNTSEAKMNIKYDLRSAMFIIGLVLYISFNILNVIL